MFFPEAKPYSLLGRLTKTQRYLEQNSKKWFAETSYDASIRFKDNFVELLMLEATGNWNLVDLRIPQRKWNYFGSKAVVTPDPYPDENDTNAIAPTIIKPVDSVAHSIMDGMLKCENEAGIIQLYDDPNRPRIVPEVSANILTFFYTFGRGHEVQKSLEWVYSVLSDRQYHPSRYYLTPEPFFYYLMRLINCSKAPELDKIKNLLIKRVKERIGSTTDNSVFLAIRLLVCQRFNIPNYADLNALLSLQEEDGSFGVGWYYKFGRSQAMIGHRGLTAAFSLEAIKGALMEGIFEGPSDRTKEPEPDSELTTKIEEVEKPNGESNHTAREQNCPDEKDELDEDKIETKSDISQPGNVNGINGVNGCDRYPNGGTGKQRNEQVKLDDEKTGSNLEGIQRDGEEAPNSNSFALEGATNGSAREANGEVDIGHRLGKGLHDAGTGREDMQAITNGEDKCPTILGS